MNPLIAILLLALLWAAITGTFSGLNLIFGGLVGGLALWLLRDYLPARHWRRAGQALTLFVVFLYELIASALRVAKVVLTPDLASALRPAIIAVPLTVRSDIEITLLANLITLTPGTLSVDVSADHDILYVHVLCLDTREALIADIASGFEARIREIFA